MELACQSLALYFYQSDSSLLRQLNALRFDDSEDSGVWAAIVTSQLFVTRPAVFERLSTSRYHVKFKLRFLKCVTNLKTALNVSRHMLSIFADKHIVDSLLNRGDGVYWSTESLVTIKFTPQPKMPKISYYPSCVYGFEAMETFIAYSAAIGATIARGDAIIWVYPPRSCLSLTSYSSRTKIS